MKKTKKNSGGYKATGVNIPEDLYEWMEKQAASNTELILKGLRILKQIDDLPALETRCENLGVTVGRAIEIAVYRLRTMKDSEFYADWRKFTEAQSEKDGD